MLGRDIVLEKLKGYLENRISKKEIYEWGLSIVTSKEYDKLDKTDKLLSDTIQALFELHHEDEKFDPSREELEYYVRCLERKTTILPNKNKEK